MTTPTPPAAPAPAAGPPFPLPAPAPNGGPDPQAATPPPAPDPGQAPPPAPPDDPLAELRAALDNERRQHRETRDRLAVLERQGMTADQRRIEDAKAEGRAAAVKEAGTRVAVEAFRAAATGRFPDSAAIEAALEALDLSKFVKDDGEVDREGITRLVDKLAPAAPSGPRIPPGAHGSPAADGDFFRQAMAKRR